MSIYSPTPWNNDSPPPINASNLGKLEQGVVDAHVELASQGVALASLTTYASTLYSNFGDEASAIAAVATTVFDQGNAIASLAAEDVVQNTLLGAQAAAVASNTTAVASLLPVVASHTGEIAELYATQIAQATLLGLALASQGNQASAIADLSATQAHHSTQIADLLAFEATTIAIDANQASQLASLSTSVYDLTVGAGGLVQNTSTLNRSGQGPVDLWSSAAGPVGVTPTSGAAHAIAMRYDPVATIGDEVFGVNSLSAWLLPNAGVASPPKNLSMALLDGLSGTVMAWTEIQPVPSVATALHVQLASYVATTVATYLGNPFWMQPDQPYYLVLASDDFFRMDALGIAAPGAAAAEARFELGLAYDFTLPSGLALASYGSFRIPPANVPVASITSAVPSGAAPQTYPAVFVK